MSFPASLLVFLLLFNACGNSQEESGNSKSAKDSTSEQSTIDADSIPDIQQPDPGLPPGTIRLKGKLLKIQDAKNKTATIYNLKVLKTLGIGSSTPPVATGDTVQFVSSNKETRPKEGLEVICTLQYQQVLEKYEDTAPRWLLLQLKDN